MMAVCLLVTLLIFSVYYRALSLRPAGISYKLVTSAVFTSAQIILSELFLGLFNQLFLSRVLIVHVAIIVLVLWISRRFIGSRHAVPVGEELVRAKNAFRAAMDGPGGVLAMLAVLAYGWILAAGYFLPPRGLDDNVYHLPAIFEYLQSHQIRLLPVEEVWPIAYPQNAELLYLWPLLFTQSQRWLSAMNVPFVLLSVLTIYALFRQLDVRPENASFAALLYALCPVVLMVAGVNYVDIIVSLFFLLSLYYSILFYEQGRLLDLLAAGLAMGLLCGMKYSGLVLVLALQILILPALRKAPWHHVAAYGLIMALAGGWWYIRNQSLLGDAFYPMQKLASMPRAERGTQGGSALQNILYNAPYWMTRYPLADSGVGKYDGGFGLVFWGMGFSSWAVVSVRSLASFRRTKFPVLVLLACLPLGFLLLFMNPPQWIDLNGRLSMFVAAIGFFALCQVLGMLNDQRLVSVVKTVCIALSIVAVSLMSVSNRPAYRLTDAAADAINHRETSVYKYMADSIPVHAMLRPAWEALDLLTRDERAGSVNCALATTGDDDLLVPAPAYGTRLQNRVLNMGGRINGGIDAYVCTYFSPDSLARPVPVFTGGGRKQTMTIGDLIARNDYVPVVQTDHVCLLLGRDLFNSAEKQRILLRYYRASWPDAAAFAQAMDPKLDPSIPFIASGDIGYGVRAVDISNSRPNRVYLAFENQEHVVAARINAQQCYSLARPVNGYRSQKVLRAIYHNSPVDVYLNRRLQRNGPHT